MPSVVLDRGWGGEGIGEVVWTPRASSRTLSLAFLGPLARCSVVLCLASLLGKLKLIPAQLGQECTCSP